jgi:cytochrome c-type biogenesis protein CcmH
MIKVPRFIPDRRGVRRAALIALAAAALTPLTSPVLRAQQTDKAKQIGGKFMCMCGCNQVLTQCNHVGCTTSTAMLKEIDDEVAQGKTEEQITQMLVQEYGTKVYAEPPKSGLSLVAWWMPTFYLVLGTVAVVFVIFRWRKRTVPAVTAASVATSPNVPPDVLARARAQAMRDTED